MVEFSYFRHYNLNEKLGSCLSYFDDRVLFITSSIFVLNSLDFLTL